MNADNDWCIFSAQMAGSTLLHHIPTVGTELADWKAKNCSTLKIKQLCEGYTPTLTNIQ